MDAACRGGAYTTERNFAPTEGEYKPGDTPEVHDSVVDGGPPPLPLRAMVELRMVPCRSGPSSGADADRCVTIHDCNMMFEAELKLKGGGHNSSGDIHSAHNGEEWHHCPARENEKWGGSLQKQAYRTLGRAAASLEGMGRHRSRNAYGGWAMRPLPCLCHAP